MTENNRKPIKLEEGDVFEIPLSNDSHGYGQYYYFDKKNGPVVRIFNLRSKNLLEPIKIVEAPLLFPPIFVGFHAAIRNGVWNIIGHVPIIDFEIPKFRYTSPVAKNGRWYLIEADKMTDLGFDLPEKYKSLETTAVWSAYDVNKRIENGGKLPAEWKRLHDQ